MKETPTFFDPTLLLLIGFMVLIYFLMIRPENKRRKTHQAMLDSLEAGDEVATAGGILGKVTKVHEQFVEISVGNNHTLRFQKNSISNVLPKGSLESI
ncbi:MAG: preprotein translocase subunit YajC [SAR86 cluster bacterium]|jgi:preprotein translocase subunit YajC|nr:preprotein translocase subunit YajC [SAR86 cluster bacterium]